MCKFKFNDKNEKKFKKLMDRYPNKKALMLPSLWMAQKQIGWVSKDAISYIASKLETSPADVYSCATFFTMFKIKPEGKYTINICQTLSCFLNGSDNIKEYVEKRYSIKNSQTTKDNRFTLKMVECLGMCEHAPALMINDESYKDITVDKLKKIMDSLEDENS